MSMGSAKVKKRLRDLGKWIPDFGKSFPKVRKWPGDIGECHFEAVSRSRPAETRGSKARIGRVNRGHSCSYNDFNSISYYKV